MYVDKDSYEVKYGIRADAEENFTGPWDCTKMERRITLEGWEGFMAVKEGPGVWALYFDRDGMCLPCTLSILNLRANYV